MPYTRTQIRLDTHKEVADFVRKLNSDGSTNKYILEDESGRHRVDARSLLGVIYASAEFGEGIYLINETHDGEFPNSVYEFFPLSSPVNQYHE